jgi:hypothetical protein
MEEFIEKLQQLKVCNNRGRMTAEQLAAWQKFEVTE